MSKFLTDPNTIVEWLLHKSRQLDGLCDNALEQPYLARDGHVSVPDGSVGSVQAVYEV